MKQPNTSKKTDMNNFFKSVTSMNSTNTKEFVSQNSNITNTTNKIANNNNLSTSHNNFYKNLNNAGTNKSNSTNKKSISKSKLTLISLDISNTKQLSVGNKNYDKRSSTLKQTPSNTNNYRSTPNSSASNFYSSQNNNVNNVQIDIQNINQYHSGKINEIVNVDPYSVIHKKNNSNSNKKSFVSSSNANTNNANNNNARGSKNFNTIGSNNSNNGNNVVSSHEGSGNNLKSQSSNKHSISTTQFNSKSSASNNNPLSSSQCLNSFRKNSISNNINHKNIHSNQTSSNNHNLNLNNNAVSTGTLNISPNASSPSGNINTQYSTGNFNSNNSNINNNNIVQININKNSNTNTNTNNTNSNSNKTNSVNPTSSYHNKKPSNIQQPSKQSKELINNNVIKNNSSPLSKDLLKANQLIQSVNINNNTKQNKINKITSKAAKKVETNLLLSSHETPLSYNQNALVNSQKMPNTSTKEKIVIRQNSVSTTSKALNFNQINQNYNNTQFNLHNYQNNNSSNTNVNNINKTTGQVNSNREKQTIYLNNLVSSNSNKDLDKELASTINSVSTKFSNKDNLNYMNNEQNNFSKKAKIQLDKVLINNNYNSNNSNNTNNTSNTNNTNTGKNLFKTSNKNYTTSSTINNLNNIVNNKIVQQPHSNANKKPKTLFNNNTNSNTPSNFSSNQGNNNNLMNSQIKTINLNNIKIGSNYNSNEIISNSNLSNLINHNTNMDSSPELNTGKRSVKSQNNRNSKGSQFKLYEMNNVMNNNMNNNMNINAEIKKSFVNSSNNFQIASKNYNEANKMISNLIKESNTTTNYDNKKVSLKTTTNKEQKSNSNSNNNRIQITPTNQNTQNNKIDKASTTFKKSFTNNYNNLISTNNNINITTQTSNVIKESNQNKAFLQSNSLVNQNNNITQENYLSLYKSVTPQYYRRVSEREKDRILKELNGESHILNSIVNFKKLLSKDTSFDFIDNTKLNIENKEKISNLRNQISKMNSYYDAYSNIFGSKSSSINKKFDFEVKYHNAFNNNLTKTMINGNNSKVSLNKKTSNSKDNSNSEDTSSVENSVNNDIPTTIIDANLIGKKGAITTTYSKQTLNNANNANAANSNNNKNEPENNMKSKQANLRIKLESKQLKLNMIDNTMISNNANSPFAYNLIPEAAKTKLSEELISNSDIRMEKYKLLFEFINENVKATFDLLANESTTVLKDSYYSIQKNNKCGNTNHKGKSGLKVKAKAKAKNYSSSASENKSDDDNANVDDNGNEGEGLSKKYNKNNLLLKKPKEDESEFQLLNISKELAKLDKINESEKSSSVGLSKMSSYFNNNLNNYDDNSYNNTNLIKSIDIESSNINNSYNCDETINNKINECLNKRKDFKHTKYNKPKPLFTKLNNEKPDTESDVKLKNQKTLFSNNENNDDSYILDRKREEDSYIDKLNLISNSILESINNGSIAFTDFNLDKDALNGFIDESMNVLGTISNDISSICVLDNNNNNYNNYEQEIIQTNTINDKMIYRKKQIKTSSEGKLRDEINDEDHLVDSSSKNTNINIIKNSEYNKNNLTNKQANLLRGDTDNLNINENEKTLNDDLDVTLEKIPVINKSRAKKYSMVLNNLDKIKQMTKQKTIIQQPSITKDNNSNQATPIKLQQHRRQEPLKLENIAFINSNAVNTESNFNKSKTDFNKLSKAKPSIVIRKESSNNNNKQIEEDDKKCIIY